MKTNVRDVEAASDSDYPGAAQRHGLFDACALIHALIRSGLGSPRSNMVNLFTDTPEDELDRELGPDRSVVMAGGHTHIQMLRKHRGTLVVNPGSVGAPFREYPSGAPPVILPHAEFAIIESRDADVAVSLHRVQLDRRALASAGASSTNPMAEQLAAPYR